MIGYFLLLALLVISIFLTIIGDMRSNGVMAVICIMVSLLLGSLFIASTMYVSNRKSDAKKFLLRRDYYQELVNNISNDMAFYAVERTIDTAKKINERIEDNREYAYSKMWGFLSNKGIAEVELIDIPEIEYKIVKKE